jgi:hypothetical protein
MLQVGRREDSGRAKEDGDEHGLENLTEATWLSSREGAKRAYVSAKEGALTDEEQKEAEEVVKVDTAKAKQRR